MYTAYIAQKQYEELILILILIFVLKYLNYLIGFQLVYYSKPLFIKCKELYQFFQQMISIIGRVYSLEKIQKKLFSNSLTKNIYISFTTQNHNQFLKSTMQKQNSSSFKLYPGKPQTPLFYTNFLNQIPQQNQFLTSNFEHVQENSGTDKFSTKSKSIKKSSDKQDLKRYDRGGNCVASNTSKLFIKILNKRLNRFPVIQNYLNYYEIYSQKENILLIPLCLYSFLKQYEHNYHNRFHQNQQIAQNKCSQQKINTRQIYNDIINQLKDHIECSLQNSRSKYKDCSDGKKQFHLKNISIYNKISEIIRKVEQMSLSLEESGYDVNDEKQHKNQYHSCQVEKISQQNQVVQKDKNSSKQNGSDIKIQQEQLHYNQFHQKVAQKVEIPYKQSFKPLQIYVLSNFQSPLQSLYERKQRQYQKAMDKVYSVIMNQRPLRQLFKIFKLNIKQILLQSVNYCYRRNINSRVKKNQKIIKEVYQRLQGCVVQNFNLREDQNVEIKLKGWEFVIAFLTLQMAGDKKEEIYGEFKENIKRKTKYYDLIQKTSSTEEKQSFDKYYYAYSLRILEQCYQTFTRKRKDFDKFDLDNLSQRIKQWLIGYYYHNTLNRILMQEPELTPKMSQQVKSYENHQGVFNQHQHPIHHQFTQFKKSHPENMMTMHHLPTHHHSHEVKQEQEIVFQIPVNEQQSRKNLFFGENQQKCLQKLILQFDRLSRENYESVLM